MKHWTSKLPEGGTIYTRHGKNQEQAQANILALEKQLEEAKREYLNQEAKILRMAEKHWETEEIQEAML